MKTLKIFLRDLKITFRQFIAVWIMFVPVVLAFIIGLATPGAADSPVRVALLKNEDPGLIAFFEKYAGAELFDGIAALEKRVLARDDVVAVIGGDGNRYLLTQGNEPEYIINAVKTLLAYRELGIPADPSAVKFNDFGRTDPPLKITLVTALVLIVTVMSGMIISVNIVDEKSDGTIRAIRVAPVRLTSFVAGKSLIGVLNSLACGALCVLAAGFFGVNFPQAFMILLSVSFISFIVGFMAGLGSSDFISAMASLKLLLIPFLASILAAELMSANWQWLFYWSPFYWAYDGIKGVLTQTARWDTVLRDAGLTAALSLIAYLAFYPGIRKKLL